jgi:hypothetical protein
VKLWIIAAFWKSGKQEDIQATHLLQSGISAHLPPARPGLPDIVQDGLPQPYGRTAQTGIFLKEKQADRANAQARTAIIPLHELA